MPLSESFAFIDWTSGTSTGKPKGVAMWHRHLTNMLLWRWSQLPMKSNSLQNIVQNSGASIENQQPELEQDDVCAVNLFGLWYWWYPIAMGCTTVVIPNYMQQDVKQVGARIIYIMGFIEIIYIILQI